MKDSFYELEPKTNTLNDTSLQDPSIQVEQAAGNLADTELTGIVLENRIEPVEANNSKPADISNERSSRISRAGVAVALSSLALLAGISQSSGESAQARAGTPAVETAKPKKSVVPRVTLNMEIPAAKQVLKKAGLKPAGLKPNADGKIPVAAPDYKLVAAGWAKKVVRRAKNPAGKKVIKISYPNVRPGTKLPRGSRLYIRTRQVLAGRPEMPNIGGPEQGNIPPPIIVPIGATPVDPTPRQENPNPAPEVDLGAETEKYLADHTAYIEFSGCSGLIYRNAGGSVKAAPFANHCLPRPEFAPREVGRDGRTYVNIGPKSLAVSTGDKVGSLTKKTEIQDVIVPKDGDITADFAVGVPRGSSVEEAIQANANASLTEQEIAQLQPESEMFSSGFPAFQLYNTDGGTKRQIWKMKYLAKDVPIKTTAGNDFRVIMTGVNETPDGALCTDGNSGAGAVVRIVNGSSVSFKTAGNNVGNYDLRPGSRNAYGFSDQLISEIKSWLHTTTGVDVSSYDGVCFFSPVQPAAGNYKVVRLVTSDSQIPR